MMIEYKVVVILFESRAVLAEADASSYRLPRVFIPAGTRRAEELQSAIRATWGLHVIVLAVLNDADSTTNFAITELLEPRLSTDLIEIRFEMLSDSELSESHRARITSLLLGDTANPLSRIGWIDGAISWIEDMTRGKIRSKSDITQLNACGTFSLIRFGMIDGQECWLKATGTPNTHEYSITRYLCEVGSQCNPYLPSLIACKREWNAWLMSGGGRPIFECASSAVKPDALLEEAVRSFARLQIATAGKDHTLLRAGAFDQRLEVLAERSKELFEYLLEAMRAQTSTKVPPIERLRLSEVREGLVAVCERILELKVPNSILHGDLNPGNILISDHCRFIDWSEAYIGFPLISLQHLLLLNKAGEPEREDLRSDLRQLYREEWSTVCDPEVMEEGFRYMPLLAAASSLYGRGDWLLDPLERDKPNRQSLARTLARHMERAVSALEAQELV
jgi:hypothetical protein